MAKTNSVKGLIAIARPYGDDASEGYYPPSSLLKDLLLMQRVALQGVREGTVDLNDPEPASYICELIATNLVRCTEIKGMEQYS